MDRATELDLIARVLGHAGAGSTDRGPAEVRVPVASYTDPAVHARETAALRALPLPVAHRSQLARPGDFVARTVLGTPVLLVRDRDGTVRGFVNACRHRAAQLLPTSAGHGLRAIVCPYHAWSYDLSGRLCGVPDGAASFPSLEPAERGLLPLPTAEHAGLLWTVPGRPGDATPPDVAGHLGPAGPELAGYGFADHQLYRTETRTWAANWKVTVEAFLENYHFAALHRRSTSKIFLNNLVVADRLGRHFRAVAPKRSIRALADHDRRTWALRPHATILYVLFPYSCLFVERGHASLLQVLPLATDRSEVVISHLVGTDGLGWRDHWDANIEVFMSAVLEDLEMAESVTAGMAALPGQEISYGRNEAACAAFHAAVDETVDAAQLAPAALS